jgi:hypothetical protein
MPSDFWLLLLLFELLLVVVGCYSSCCWLLVVIRVVVIRVVVIRVVVVVRVVVVAAVRSWWWSTFRDYCWMDPQRSCSLSMVNYAVRVFYNRGGGNKPSDIVLRPLLVGMCC